MFNYLNTKLNDKALTKVEKIFTEMSIAYSENKRLAEYSEDYIEDKYTEIGTILSDRFGFTLTIENGTKSNIFVYPSISQYTIDLKNKIKKKLDKMVVKKGLTDKTKTILYTLDDIEQELRNGLKIDTDDMVILSNNDFKFNINLNYDYLMENNLSPREIVAIILHEIGHIFNGLLLLPNTVANAADLMYNIIGTLQDDKDMGKTILKISNSTETDVTNEVVFNMYKTYILDKNQYFTGYSRNITNENTADLFAVKFNYGSDLANGITKLGDVIIKSDTIKNTVIGLELFIAIGAIIANYGLDVTIGLAASTLIGFAYITMFIVGTIAFLVWLFSRLLGTGQLMKDTNTHEDVKTRIERLKNKVISLAKNNPDKESAKATIKELKSLNGLLRNISDTLGVKVNKILMANSEYTVITLTDKLINNELFIQSLRLKYLKGE